MASLHLAQEIFNLIYPVGSVYLSVNQTNPSTLFGGTWTRITDGFLYCISGNGGGQGNLQGSAKSAGTAITTSQLPKNMGSFRVLTWKGDNPTGIVSKR